MMSEDKTAPPTRESFYNDLNGTDTLDIALIASGAPLCVLLRFSITSALVYLGGAVLKPWQNFVVEFCTLVVPCILGVTLISTHILALLATLAVSSVTLLLVMYRHSNHQIRSSQAHDRLTLQTLLNTKHTTRNKLQFVTAFRVYAMIVTAICILAVDFVAFPRRLAKTELYGTGLMDAGVGVFTLANALVSPEARGTYKTVKGVRNGLECLLKSSLTALPIIALGFIRLASVNAADYHVHVSEYGVHWNFFFTLATVSILSSICLTMASPHMSGILALFLAAGYQMQLSNQGLGEFVLYGDDGQGSREGFLNANREGLVSCIGYLIIYLAGVQLGRFLFLPRSSIREWCMVFLVLCVVNTILWIMLQTSVTSIEPVCRRSANLSYIIWTLAYCVHMLACFLVVEIITVLVNRIVQTTHRSHTEDKNNESTNVNPPIAEAALISAINRNQLVLFLLANLVTGVVNMSIDTIGYGELPGFVIVTGYMLVLCIIGLAMHRYNISVKFW